MSEFSEIPDDIKAKQEKESLPITRPTEKPVEKIPVATAMEALDAGGSSRSGLRNLATAHEARAKAADTLDATKSSSSIAENFARNFNYGATMRAIRREEANDRDAGKQTFGEREVARIEGLRDAQSEAEYQAQLKNTGATDTRDKLKQ